MTKITKDKIILALDYVLYIVFSVYGWIHLFNGDYPMSMGSFAMSSVIFTLIRVDNMIREINKDLTTIYKALNDILRIL